jgi:hypothetical protein
VVQALPLLLQLVLRLLLLAAVGCLLVGLWSLALVAPVLLLMCGGCCGCA